MVNGKPTLQCPCCQVPTAYAKEELIGKRWTTRDGLHAHCTACGRYFTNDSDPAKRTFVWDTVEKNVYPPHADRLHGIIRNAMNVGHRRDKEFKMCFERSEDALVWSVFNTLEDRGLLERAYEFLSGGNERPKHCTVSYWGYNDRDREQSEEINSHYREILGRAGEPGWPGGYSEPDILLVAPGSGLITVEAKYKSRNDDKLAKKGDTQSYERRRARAQAMLDQGKEYILKSSAVDWSWYELLRMWVPGCVLAKQLKCPCFTLVNLLPRELLRAEGARVTRDMRECVKSDASHSFNQLTWEDFGQAIRGWDTDLGKDFWGYFRKRFPAFDGSA